MAELKDAVVRLIRESLFKVDNDGERGHHNLICDALTLRILGSLCRMSDLYELGVTSIEDISNARRAMPNLDALYFLSIQRDSISKLLADYGKQPQHANVHLVFCDKVPAHIFEELAQHKGLAPRVKSFKEAGINFVMFHQDAFHLGHPNVVQFFNDQAAVQICGDGILSICNILKLRPTIRYAKSGCCPDVARMVHDAQKNDSIPTKAKSTLLIVDRSMDVQAALLHESTYEALIYDVIAEFDHKSDTINLGGKPRLLHDNAFSKLKYMHFLDAQKRVKQDLANFSKQHANLSKVQKGSGGDLELSDMIAAIRGVPEFQEQFQAFETNLALVKRIMEELEAANVIVQRREDNKFQQNVGSLEAELATGITDSIKEAKVIQMTSTLTGFFRSGPALPNDVKMRLILLYLALFNDVSAQTRQTIIEAANISGTDHSAINRFLEVGLGGEPDYSGKAPELKRTKSQLNLAKKDLKSQTNIIARFTPRLKTLMERLIDNLLPTDDFPGFDLERIADAYGGAEGRNWGWKNVNAGGGDSKSKLLVFVIGGVTLSEIRVAQQLAKSQSKCDVLIGGTCVLTPGMLLDSLRGTIGPGTQADEVRINID